MALNCLNTQTTKSNTTMTDSNFDYAFIYLDAIDNRLMHLCNDKVAFLSFRGCFLSSLYHYTGESREIMLGVLQYYLDLYNEMEVAYFEDMVTPVLPYEIQWIVNAATEGYLSDCYEGMYDGSFKMSYRDWVAQRGKRVK